VSEKVDTGHQRTRSSRAGRSAKCLLLISLIIAGLMATSLWVRLSFWFELFSTYSPQLTILVTSLLLMVVALAVYESISRGWRSLMKVSLKSWVTLTLVLLLMGHNLIVIWITPQRATFNEISAESGSLRVMTLNKLYNNNNYSQIANYIQSRDPDILAIEEIFKDEAALLAKLMGYEHWHMASCGCSAYGSDLALFSRFPLDNVSLAFEDRLGGVLRGEVTLSVDRTLAVYVAHIVVPYSSSAYEIRRNMINQLADSINQERLETVLMGDFNASPYSVDIRSLAKQTTDISLVGDRPWSRCTWFGYSELLCADIDHIFVPKDSVVSDYEIGPAVGSDHRPIDVDLVLSD